MQSKVTDANNASACVRSTDRSEINSGWGLPGFPCSFKTDTLYNKLADFGPGDGTCLFGFVANVCAYVRIGLWTA